MVSVGVRTRERMIRRVKIGGVFILGFMIVFSLQCKACFFMVLKSLIEKCSHDSSLPINVPSENGCFQRSTSTSGIVKKPIRERSPTVEGFLERAPPIPENLSRKNPLILWKLRSPPLTHSWSSPNFLNSHLGWQR